MNQQTPISIQFSSSYQAWVLCGDDLPICQHFPIKGQDKQTTLQRVLSYLGDTRPGVSFTKINEDHYCSEGTDTSNESTDSEENLDEEPDDIPPGPTDLYLLEAALSGEPNE